MAGFIEGIHRNQRIMFPESVDEYIGDDNAVRFIDAFVESLDLEALGFERAVPKETGRPPYDPGDLLKLYTYGYLNQIRSSRRLEKEAHRNVELMWLLRKLAPDFKTIADFRRHNGRAIREVCRQFTLLCRQLSMFGGELVAIDGSKFNAVNSRGRNFTRPKLKRMNRLIDEKIERYLQELDENDELELDSYRPTAGELREKIEALQKRKQEYQELQERLDAHQETQISLTDCDARSMPVGKRRGTDLAYNVQISVDDKHHLIVDHEVTNAVTDQGQLSRMAMRAKEALQVERLETEETRNTDVYQVLAYCKAFGCGLAGLIYPSWEGRGGSLVIRNSDIRIEHVLIDLGSEGPAFDAECRRFVNTVVNLATQQTESPPLRAGSYGQAGVAAGA